MANIHSPTRQAAVLGHSICSQWPQCKHYVKVRGDSTHRLTSEAQHCKPEMLANAIRDHVSFLLAIRDHVSCLLATPDQVSLHLASIILGRLMGKGGGPRILPTIPPSLVSYGGGIQAGGAAVLLMIKMHASNFRIIVCMWKPFRKCFVSIRRSWDPRSSVINALATFLLLSSFKLFFLTNKLAIHTKPFCKGRNKAYGISSLEPPNTIYKHPYYVCSLILSVLLVCIPSLFLVLYPTKLARMLMRRIFPGRLSCLLTISWRVSKAITKMVQRELTIIELLLALASF